jgi:predicted O-linked N-acetylglucosamine transferase (SPINDLY family)
VTALHHHFEVSAEGAVLPLAGASTQPNVAAVRGALALGLARHRAGDLDAAERHYRRVIRRHPDDVDALHMLGVVRGAKGDLIQGERLLRAAIARCPERAEPWSNLGSLLLRGRRPADAVVALREACARDPDLPDALANLAGALLELQQPVAAEHAARRALANAPDHAVALANLGAALLAQGRLADSQAALRAAAATGHCSVALLRNAGQAHLAAGDAGAARDAFRRALAIDSADLECRRGLAFALARLREISEAESLLVDYVARRPQPSNAHFMLGHLRVLAGRQEEGRELLRAGALRPDAPAAEASTYLFDLNYMPDITPVARRAAHEAWDLRFAQGLASAPVRRDRDPQRPLRVGVLSPDLRAHAVSFFLRPLLSGLDAAELEVIAYANVARPDIVTEELRQLVAGWRDIRPCSDDEAAQTVRADRIDVLIDLAGHTADNRLLVLARRPAPVQVGYLGYPATTGMAAIDARIVDRWTDPEGAEAHASERLLRLDRCFLAYAPTAYPEVVAPPFRRNGNVTFGSFNNLAKLNSRVIELWSRVLHAVDGSKLVLKHDATGDAGIQQHLAGLFARHGIGEDRLRFLSRTPDLVSHLAAYAEVDVALDPFPYNGTTTTCEALWMGVPVVTLTGDHHAARVGTSLLTAVGFAPGIAADADDYVRTCVQLARAPSMLDALRTLLRPEMAASPLCDGVGLAEAFTGALRSLWREWCAHGHIARPAHAPDPVLRTAAPWSSLAASVSAGRRGAAPPDDRSASPPAAWPESAPAPQVCQEADGKGPPRRDGPPAPARHSSPFEES